jgi:alpha-maltose-1-phosphate synthase
LNKQIIVSHPGKQYVHQLLFAIQQTGGLQLFITSIWYKPSHWVCKLLVSIPLIGDLLYQKFLKKKTYPNQDDRLVEQYPWKEVWRQLLVQFSYKYRTEKYVFEVERAHDRYAARRLRNLKPDIFIGYEKASLESFKVIKSQGGVTVLDLAQVHYNYLVELQKTQATFEDLFEDKVLFQTINKVKGEEYQLADYILTLSSFAKQTLLDNGIPENKIRVVNLGYNPALFTPKTTYNQSGGLKLIYTGTFTKRKGVHLLLQAIEELALPDLHLTIIGPVLDGQELLKQYKGLFEYYDFMHHEELVKHLHASDVYVFPSLLDSWAMTVVEAMACGLPVIVTENTGAKDVVEDGVSGFVIPIADKEAIKEKILFFHKDRQMVEKFGNNASRSVEKNSWGDYHQQIQEFVTPT